MTADTTQPAGLLQYTASQMGALMAERDELRRELDWYLRAKVADLVYLLSYADITTPSVGDAEQAERILDLLRAYLKQDAPQGAAHEPQA